MHPTIRAELEKEPELLQLFEGLTPGGGEGLTDEAAFLLMQVAAHSQVLAQEYAVAHMRDVGLVPDAEHLARRAADTRRRLRKRLYAVLGACIAKDPQDAQEADQKAQG